MNRRSLYIFSFVFVISLNALGQSPRNGEQSKDTTITLIEKIDGPKTVILLKNRNFTVKTSLADFEDSANDERLLNPVLEKAERNKIVDTSKIARDNNLTPILRYRMAALLENGKCLVVSKNGKKTITTEIKVQTYSYHCGDLCGDGGRRFYVNGILLLQVNDWVS